MKRKVACLLADGFEDSELKAPQDALQKAGFEVDIVGFKLGQRLVGKANKEAAKVTCGVDDASVANYAALLIPGGASPAKLCEDARFVSFVKEFAESKKPIAAICHGPQLLIRAGVVKGRTLTAYRDVQAALQKSGATVRDEAVVADGNFITSRTPADLTAFCEAIVAQFEVNADQSWMARGETHPQ